MSCSVSDCGGPLFAGGMCSRHYNRKRTTGTTDDGPRARLSLEARLWRNVRRGGAAECWEWTGRAKISGYGFISLGGRGDGKAMAHRVSWEIHNGPIPSGTGYHGTIVMHTCDNRLCVNPAHLRLGTQTENVRDMDAKGRRRTVVRVGSKHHNSKLTEDAVRFIRASSASNKELGARFGVTPSAIGFVRRRIVWKHVV